MLHVSAIVEYPITHSPNMSVVASQFSRLFGKGLPHRQVAPRRRAPKSPHKISKNMLTFSHICCACLNVICAPRFLVEKTEEFNQQSHTCWSSEGDSFWAVNSRGARSTSVYTSTDSSMPSGSKSKGLSTLASPSSAAISTH